VGLPLRWTRGKVRRDSCGLRLESVGALEVGLDPMQKGGVCAAFSAVIELNGEVKHYDDVGSGSRVSTKKTRLLCDS
jgi:hypothetical protein